MKQGSEVEHDSLNNKERSAAADKHADDERDPGSNAHGLPRIVVNVPVSLFGSCTGTLHSFVLRVREALTRNLHGFPGTLARSLNLLACLARSCGKQRFRVLEHGPKIAHKFVGGYFTHKGSSTTPVEEV
jgi:hypothetical protein